MTTLTMKYDNRPDGDPIELPNVGLFANGEKVTLEDWQKDALERHYGLKGTAFTFPLKGDKADEVTLNLTGEVTEVQETSNVDESENK